MKCRLFNFFVWKNSTELVRKKIGRLKKQTTDLDVLHNGIILIVNCFKFVWQIYVIFFASKRVGEVLLKFCCL